MRVLKNLEELPDFNKSVLTLGSFDGVHFGHQKIIERLNQLAKEIEGESLVISFDPHPRSIIYPKDTGLKLLSTLEEKLQLFDKYQVDNVIIVPFTVEFSQISPREYIEEFIIAKFKPEYVVIGYDHKFGLNRSGDISLLREYEKKGYFKLIEIEKKELEEITISSTKIRNALLEGELDLANGLSNHNYKINGTVVHGNKIGGKIGYPTANIRVSDKRKLIPKIGIYAAKAVVDSEAYRGMLYIGRRPSIEGTNELAIEIHLFDFNDNIYNQKIQLELISFIREDEKFENLDLLKNQMALDELAVRNVLNKYEFEAPVSKIAIAILNYNGKHHLESYLPSVSYSTDAEFDLYVIDNASTDDSIQYCNEWFPEVKIIPLLKNHGFAGGYNKAIEQIGNEYLVILNSDVLVASGWLDPLIELLEKDNSLAAVMPKILSLEERAYFEYAGASGGYIDALGYPFCRGRIFETLEKDSNQYDQIDKVFWTSGAAMVIRTDLFKKLGGFDADYFAHMEEIDLCWRLKRAGYELLVCPDSVVYHLGGGTMSYDNPRKAELNFRNNLFTIFKNEHWIKLLWLLPLRFILDIAAGLYFLIKGKPKNLLSVFKAYLAFAKHLPSLLRKRKDYNQRIASIGYGAKSDSGRYGASVLWQYFVLGKKHFSEFYK